MELGNNITLGNLIVKSIYFGNIKVYPTTTPTYINISTTITGITSAYTTISITVDASDSNWTVMEQETWLSVVKTDSTHASITAMTNPNTTARTGYVYFQIDSTTYATLTIGQAAAADTPFPQEWGVLAEDGNWAFATMPYPDDASKTLVAVIYRYRNEAPPNSVEYILDCTYLHLEDGDSVEDTIYNEYTIEPYDTITVDGEVYYGAFVDVLDSMVVDGQTMYYIQDLEDLGPVYQFSVSVV